MPQFQYRRTKLVAGAILVVTTVSACADQTAPYPSQTRPTPSASLSVASADPSVAGPPAMVVITSWPQRLVPGQQQRLQARAWDSAGREITAPQLTWFTTAPKVATVDAAGNVTARSVGSTDVWVQLHRQGSGIASTVMATLTVQAGARDRVASLTVAPSVLRLTAGDSSVLSFTARTSDGTIVTDCTYRYGTSNQARATVHAPGVVRAVAAGIAAIVVGCQNQGVQVPVFVSAKPAIPPVVATSPVEVLGAAPATQVRDGLGFNVDQQQPWQFALAKDVGAREVRMQFGWNHVEPVAGQLGLEPADRAALTTASQLGLRPLVVAAYGPNWTRLPQFTVSAPAAVGDTVISLVPSPTLANVARGYSYVQRANGSQIVAEGYWAYSGAYVSSVRPGASQIVLAAPLTTPLATGDHIAVNNRFYKPPVPGNASDPSLAAYLHYTQYLASQIAAAGISGQVEVWNEPPWVDDRWDGGEGCFFAFGPERNTCQSTNYTFATELMKTTAPSGVRYTWGGTHKTGFATLIAGQAGQFHNMDVTQANIANSMSAEAFHPYGPSPEYHAWDPSCLTRAGVANIFATCALAGTNQTSNLKWARKMAMDHAKQTGWTIDQTITEAGLYTSNDVAKARYLMRFYLASHALGFKRVNFYRLVDGASGTPNWGVVDATTHNPTLPFQALKSLMAELDGMVAAPAMAYDSTSLPAVTAAQTTWPVTTAALVGRASAGATHNTVVLTLWQRTYPKTSDGAFDQIASPAAGRVAVRVPTGYTATRAWSLVDQSPVAITVRDANTVEVSVTDDPVAIRFTPQ